MSFSVTSQFVLGGWVHKFPFLTTWPKKRAPQNITKLGASANQLLQKRYESRNGQFWTKNNPETPAIMFALYLIFEQQEHNILLKPLFHSVLANAKRKLFQKLNLKQRNLKKNCTPFLNKKQFLEDCQIIGHRKHNIKIACAKTA